MRILGFDTATRATAVALCDLGESDRVRESDRVLEARDDPPAGARPGHAMHLMPLVVDLLERSGGGWDAIDRIAVGVGPGTFTGLRIGIATANAIGHARGIPLLGISTLETLALGAARDERAGEEQHPGRRAEVILAAIDARRGEVFAAAWRTAANRLTEQVLRPAALAPHDLATWLETLGATVLAVGDGAVEFRSALKGLGTSIPDDDSDLHRVSATNHCLLAGRMPAGDSEDIRPEYLRLPDAEIARRAAGRQ